MEKTANLSLVHVKSLTRAVKFAEALKRRVCWAGFGDVFRRGLAIPELPGGCLGYLAKTRLGSSGGSLDN